MLSNFQKNQHKCDISTAGLRGLRNRGFALVIVLALLVLITALAVTFLSRALVNRQMASHSANAIRADVLARGAVDLVIGDLKQEIAAGSTSLNGNGFDEPVFIAATGKSAMPFPTRIERPPNLLKWSDPVQFFDSGATEDGDASFPNAGVHPPSSRVSSVLTTTASSNGRSIPPARWNRPLLLPKANPAGTDPTPVMGGPAGFTIPHWIYIDRNGGHPSTPGSDVLGRFAYVIYDEGGLLDMNVAGYPSLNDGTPLDVPGGTIGRKGTLAAADLTRIGMTGADTEALVNWRNEATLSAGGTHYIDQILANTGDNHLRVGGRGARSDRAFTSRQALIEFVSRQLPSSTLAQRQNLLQFMGTFSREVDAPSWSPDSGRPRVRGESESTPRKAVLAAGGNMAAKTDNDLINPVFPDVRVRSAFTRVDGTQAVVGEPLVKTRFPLERLAWLTHKGPSAENMAESTVRALIEDYGFSEDYLRQGTRQAILASFGLVWDASKHRWTYDHGIPQSILRLDEVAALPGADAREPDFFELLNAAIHVGSLGSSFTVQVPSSGSGPTRPDERRFGTDTIATDIPWVWPHQQVMEIGACIIDQFDVDSFPTEIFFLSRFDNGFSANHASVFGQENLPTLHRLYGVLFRRTPFEEPTPPEPVHYGMGEFGCYLFPEVWNVNDPAYEPPVTNPDWVPQQIRFEAQFPAPSQQITMNPNTSDWNFVPINQRGTIEWTMADFDAREPVVAFANPQLVINGPDGLSDLAGVPVVRARCEFIGPPWERMQVTNVDRPADVADIAAYVTSNGTQTPRYFRGLSSGDPGHGGCLQFQDGSGNWRPYNRLLNTSINMNNDGVRDPSPAANQIKDASSIASIADLRFSGTPGWKASTTVRPDPRTDRIPPTRHGLGANPDASGQTSSLRPDASLGWGGGANYFVNLFSTGPASWVTGHGGQNGYYLGLLGINQNTGGMFKVGSNNVLTYHADPDGIIRGADGMYEGRQSDGSYAATSRWDGRSLARNDLVGGGRNFSRPIVLDRPFRSIGELGYAFRGDVWKSIDFFSGNSGDAALLDLFSVSEPSRTGLRAGVVNPNTHNAEVIDAVLSGGIKDESLLSGWSGAKPVALTPSQVGKIRDALVNLTTVSPLKNRGEMVTRFVGSDSVFPLLPTGGTADDDASVVKRRREAPVRALVDVSATRTWNLMIDVIVQAGRQLPGNTTGQGFLVESEKRYWVHLALDRVSGKVVDSIWEAVNE